MRAPTCSWWDRAAPACRRPSAPRAPARPVIVTTKSALGAGNTGRAQGGIQAAMGDDDSPESHYEDTFAAGHHAARPELVRRLADGGPTRSPGSTSLGVAFTRDDGRLRLLRCGGASRKRLLQAGERTGAEMVRALRAAVRASGAEVWEATRLVDLEPVGDGWRATVAPGGNGTRRTVRAARRGARRRRGPARRGRRARRRQHQPPRRHPRGAAAGARAGRRGARARLLAAPPDRLGVARGSRRLRPARDHPRLRRHPPRRRRRALRRRAGPARRGGPGHHRRRRRRAAASPPPTAAPRRLARHRRRSTARTAPASRRTGSHTSTSAT